MRRLRDILRLDDFEPAARRHLPRPLFSYVSGGVEDNVSRSDNRAAFREWGFLPRVLVGVGNRSLATELLGHTYALPFGIAPMGISALTAYRGDLVQARAAAATNIPMILSGSSLIRMEDVLAAAPDTWFQAYLPAEDARIDALVDRAAHAGFRTLMVTVDTQATPNREHNLRAGFASPLEPSLRLAWDGLVRPRWLAGTFLRTLARHGMPHFENSYAERGVAVLSKGVAREFGERGHITWRHIERIRRRWQGKLVVKGLLHPEDGRIAQAHGADAVVVSNHGGRQLDGAVSPLRVLPEVVAACAGMPVIYDGGVRRGTDVLKALALGARFVLVGRPFNYAAAIAGEEGVRHAIALLASEVDRDMAMLGVTATAQLSPACLRRLS
ncbi:MAG: alpha-hydroxy-acid oxidizing protein [Burkholderiales bacterium]|nr:alpha-hydroxy-acid oxidizing protein [Burkholderiales bacterium]